MRRLILILAVLALATPAVAQTRSAADREVLTELARTLGESHALRQACKGAEDQYWRERMKTMMAAEQPDPAFQDRLEAAFNSGFDMRQRQFTSCSADSRKAETQVSARGQSLARRLSK